ncbi:hypothetical protein ABIA14_000448 [Sinorhizobium fredii]
MDPLPHRQATDAARRAGQRDSEAGCGDCHEAPRQDRRGPVPDRLRRRGRSRTLLEDVGGRPPHRPVSAGRARRIGPAVDLGKIVWAGGRDRRPCCGVRSRRQRGYNRTRAGLRLFRHRQIVCCQRTPQDTGSTTRSLRVRQVRSVQARHPIRDPGTGVAKSRASGAKQERCGTGSLALRATRGVGGERCADS